MLRPVSRIVDLLDPALNRITNMSVDEARGRVLEGNPGTSAPSMDPSRSWRPKASPCGSRGRSIARCATSWPSATRARRSTWPIESIRSMRRSTRDGLDESVSPELHAHDPGPLRRRDRARRLSRSRSRSIRGSSRRRRNSLPATLDEIGGKYVGAMAHEIEKWLRHVEAGATRPEPIGVAFSGGIDSGAVFLVTLSHHAQPRPLADAAQGLRPQPRQRSGYLDQARAFLSAAGLVGLPRGDRCLTGRPRPRRNAARARRLQAA